MAAASWRGGDERRTLNVYEMRELQGAGDEVPALWRLLASRDRFPGGDFSPRSHSSHLVAMKRTGCGTVQRSEGFTSASKEGRERRITHLDTLGWELTGGWWISPYTGTRFTLQTALDVEDLRGSFKNGWFERELIEAASI